MYFIPKDFDCPLVGDSINTPMSCIFDGHNETLHKISLFSSFSAPKGKSSISAVYATMNIIIVGLNLIKMNLQKTFQTFNSRLKISSQL